MSCHVSEKKKRKKTKSLLFQSNISKIRYSKKGVILNLLLDFFCPIMMKHSRKTKSRKILLPPFPLLLITTTRRREFRKRDRQIYRNFSILNRRRFSLFEARS